MYDRQCVARLQWQERLQLLGLKDTGCAGRHAVAEWLSYIINGGSSSSEKQERHGRKQEMGQTVQ